MLDAASVSTGQKNFCFTVFHRFALLRFFAARRAAAIPVRRFGAGIILSTIMTCGITVNDDAPNRTRYGNKQFPIRIFIMPPLVVVHSSPHSSQYA
ncbi:TPA: hypothetical protein ACWR7G_004988, partial [Escherichia coli]